ncbi:MAG: hypothetical protein IT537_09325 [Hyphomicrobiales bacterium]|nr:hypothetical protein [Hyphomicrobiales bacterium]
MQKRETTRGRVAIVAVVLAAVITVLPTVLPTWTGSSAAWAADDEEDVPLDTKMIRQFLKDLGLQRDGSTSGIEYRERAPLVVPPSRDLPPPQSESALTQNPAWPKDPDVKQRNVDALKKKQPKRTAAETMEAEARPLSRDQLEQGRVATTGSTTITPGGSPTPEQAARPLTPSELGSTKSIFGSMFSSFKDEGEKGVFTGEPPRTMLTAPPPGYMTPSPNQPYGLGPENKNKNKAMTLEERTAGQTR